MKIMIAIIVMSFLIGCAGTHCIAVDGSWKGINGKIEYCFGDGQTSVRPVGTDIQGNQVVLLTREDVEKIGANMAPQESASIAANDQKLEKIVQTIINKIYPK